MSQPQPIRTIRQAWKSQPTLEGAGVHLRRAFGFTDPKLFDPFLLLDDFRSDTPADYLAGFPWHPHRGIETITYVLDGEVEHEDSLGNGGVIGSGDIQWMTAGSGILHQEMPKGSNSGRMYGFQLWANLPANRKMMDPRYRDVGHDTVPLVHTADGAEIRLIAGRAGETDGPVHDVVSQPEYMDVSLRPGSEFVHAVPAGHTVFAYVFDGEGQFEPEVAGANRELYGNGSIVLYGEGDSVRITAEHNPVRFLLASGKPIGEPVAWRGPIVMNTNEELATAFQDLEKGTFIRSRR